MSFIINIIIGFRLYFSCYNTQSSFGGISVQEDVIQVPVKLELISARPPPASPDRLLTSFNPSTSGTTATEIGTGFYTSGLMIGASFYNQDTFCLMGVSPDLAFIQQKQMWSEITSFLYVDGQAFAISEIPQPHKYPRDAQGISFNEMDTQVTMYPRQFLVLSDLGISIVAKRLPIDFLVQLLQEANGKITPSLRHFFESFGPDQSCAMCLAIACGNPYVHIPLTSPLPQIRIFHPRHWSKISKTVFWRSCCEYRERCQGTIFRSRGSSTDARPSSRKYLSFAPFFTFPLF